MQLVAKTTINRYLYLINTDLWVHDIKRSEFHRTFPIKESDFFLMNSDFDTKSVFLLLFHDD